MDPAWEEAIEGCLGYLATEKSHALNSQLINRIALEGFAEWMDQHHMGLEPGLIVKSTSAPISARSGRKSGSRLPR